MLQASSPDRDWKQILCCYARPARDTQLTARGSGRDMLDESALLLRTEDGVKLTIA
jgi:hypothetical protein